MLYRRIHSRLPPWVVSCEYSKIGDGEKELGTGVVEGVSGTKEPGSNDCGRLGTVGGVGVACWEGVGGVAGTREIGFWGVSYQ